MLIPPKPTNERERLAVLQSCGVLDSDPEPAYDDIAKIATQVCATPIGLVTLIDDRRQWFKSRVGLAAPETPREQAFCAHAILDATHPLIVPDAVEDARFAHNPLVTGDPHIRFYAGIPLVLDGHAVGTLCVIDRVPRELSAKQLDALSLLARQITNELRLRRKLAALQSQVAPPKPPIDLSPAPTDTVLTDVFREAPLPLDTIGGRWRLGEILGVGGMGLVVGATDLVTGRDVAIKFLLPAARLDTGRIEQFVREARLLMRVRGEHVTRILDAGNLGNGAPFIVMERLVGEDLHAWLERRRTPTPGEAADLLVQACAGVAQVHAAGILHLDLKPSNLFLARRDAGPPIVKVLDFGVARSWRSDDLAPDTTPSDEDLAGSPQYMSPEQLMDGAPIDVRSDVWSLGIVLFELLAGVRPFDSESVVEICEQVLTARPPRLSLWRPDLPAGMEQVVARCLQKDRNKRYATVDDLARALAGFVVRPDL